MSPVVDSVFDTRTEPNRVFVIIRMYNLQTRGWVFCHVPRKWGLAV